MCRVRLTLQKDSQLPVDCSRGSLTSSDSMFRLPDAGRHKSQIEILLNVH